MGLISEKRAVVTICIGDEFQELMKLTTPFMQSYANRVSADFIIIDTVDKKIIPNTEYSAYWAKLMLGNILEHPL